MVRKDILSEIKGLLVKNNIFNDIIGQNKVKEQLKSALLMNRHVIIVGPPGVGKTTLSKNLAKLLPEIDVVEGCPYNCDPNAPICPACKGKEVRKAKRIKGIDRFVRVQGSPDLTAEDLLGDIDPLKALKFGPMSIEAFTPGKIFKANRGILFFDEINRCPEKLQNALLQVLEEGKATLSSYYVEIPANFILIATMNPEDSSTERLSDVFIDRFDIIYMNYPETIDIEKEIVVKNGKKLDVSFSDDLLRFAVGFVRSLREDENLEKKPSVRASIGLYERAQSNALIKGRKRVKIDDIEDVVISVLAHRIRLKPSIRYLQTPEAYIEEAFGRFMQEKKEITESGGCR